MKKRVFVTIFPYTEGVGITKDIGQTPQVMASSYGYDSYLVTYNNGDDYENWRIKYAPNIRVKYLHKSGQNSEFKDELRFIIKHARQIDVLHMFHMGIQHLICLWIYKILNPKGVSYLRLDIDYPSLKGHSELEKWKKKVIHFLHKGTDIVSAESKVACRRYEEIFGVIPICVPIGFVDINSSITSAGNKEKIIMTAGRLGTKQKATEILLEAFAKTHSTSDWKLVLAGPISKSFNTYLETYRKQHVDIIDRIIFTGNISDKEELYSYMERASIFAMPSRWGASETVLVEALSRGCYLMMSDQIPPFEEYTNNGKYGTQILADDIDAWAKGIDAAIDCWDNNGFNACLASKYGKESFNWKTILGALEKEIDKVREA